MLEAPEALVVAKAGQVLHVEAPSSGMYELKGQGTGVAVPIGQ